MSRKIYLSIVIIVCFLFAFIVVRIYIHPGQNNLQILQLDKRIPEDSNKKELNKSSVVETIIVQGEQHLQLIGIVEQVILNSELNDNTITLSLKDSTTSKFSVHLGPSTYRLFVRRYEANSRQYKGKVMVTQDILPLLSKNKELQVELGLPKDRNDEDIIKKITGYSTIQSSQNTTLDIPQHLIVRLSIL